MLMQQGPGGDATVTVCHSRTRDLPAVTRGADILIVAIGRAKFVTADMVKPGAVVIDVGINRTEAGLVGDVDFEAVKEVAGSITPVPGGVGPLTVDHAPAQHAPGGRLQIGVLTATVHCSGGIVMTSPKIQRALLSVSDKTRPGRFRPRPGRRRRGNLQHRRHAQAFGGARAFRSATSPTIPAFPR